MLPEIYSAAKELNELDRAFVIATYFGFRPVKAPRISREDIEAVRKCTTHPYYNSAEKAAVIRNFLDTNLDTPKALVYKKPVSKAKELGTHDLHIIGITSAIAEATIIRAALSILSEEGYKNLRVDINCVGDKESIKVYERELISFVKKYGSNLPKELKEKLKEDVRNIFSLEAPEILELRSTIPSSITFLSTPSRTYFKEVLEYMEALGVEFRLVPELVGDRYHVSHTIFSIRDSDGEEEEFPLAVGYRYSRLPRLLGVRKEISCIGITLFSNEKRQLAQKTYKGLPKPKFLLVQLGQTAKIKTLSLIELLRSHRIPVYHFLDRDKIGTQLSNADGMPVSHIIIVGQKEAIDNTATIRNMSTRAQETVGVNELPGYLKKIKL